MEILSDAKFRGTINIVSPDQDNDNGFVFSGSNCTLYLKGNGAPDEISFQIGPDTKRILITPSDFSNESSIKLDSGDFSGGLSFGNGTMSLYLGSVGDSQSEVIISNYLDEHGNSVRFAKGLTAESGCVVIRSGDLVLKGSSISNWTDLNNILSFAKAPKTFSSPSIPANCTAFEFTGTAISGSNKTHLIQVQNTSTGKSVIAETWITTNKKPAMSFAGCTSTVAAGTYTAIVL